MSDALAEHPNQIDKSPYAYAWNNPIFFTDPDGNCPKCPKLPGFLNDAFSYLENTTGPAIRKYGRKAGEFLASFNPLVTANNIKEGITNGKDSFGNEMSTGSTALEIASSLPITKPLKLLKGADEAADVVNAVIKSSDEAAETVAKSDAFQNTLNHIFNKSEHNLDNLVKAFDGSPEKAFSAVQDAANKALKNGDLTTNTKGILPSGDAGHIIEVAGQQVRLIGGRVKDGAVQISSFSQKGL